MARKTLTFALFALIAITAHAQHFEWAKGYGSSQEGCLIKGTVTDSDGNLYILGQFTKDATWDGHRILPIAPYGPGQNSINTLIAKISPSGEMLWKKVIHSNNNQSSAAIDMCLAGDSLIWILTRFTLPVSSNEYLYILDTLVTAGSSYPITTNNIANPVVNGLFAINIQGDVAEQHILQAVYRDAEGRLITYDRMSGDRNDSSIYLSNYLIFEDGGMIVDNDGNIVFCRPAMDYVNVLCDTCPSMTLEELSVENGKISAIEYLIDGRTIGSVTPQNCPEKNNIQLLKFSQHMNNLIADNYAIQHCDNKSHGLSGMKLRTDLEGSIYLMANIGNGGDTDNHVMVDTLTGKSFMLLKENIAKGFMVKYNSTFLPLAVVSITDSLINRSNIAPLVSRFSDIIIDHDSNLVIVTGECSRNVQMDTTSTNSLFLVGNEILESNRGAGGVFFFTLNLDDFSIHSQGAVPSVYGSQNYGFKNLIASKNNRVFLQCKYTGGIRLPEGQISTPNYNSPGLCLLVFDIRGNLIRGIDYNSFSSRNSPGTLNLHDSILYVTNTLNVDATFGSHTIQPQGIFACMAKYIDTAFMTPYVHTEEPGEVSITLVEDGAALVAYPNPFRQSVRIKVQGGQLKEHNGTVTAILTDLTGRHEEVRLVGSGERRVESGECVYTLDLSSRPQATYLLTLTTADGRQHTVRLLKQSDMFGN